jgi:hypothetical protein
MRRLCATGLVVLLGAHPLLADGPLTRAAAREAGRLADHTSPSQEPTAWTRVRALEPGRKIIVTTDGGVTSGSFVEAGPSTLSLAKDGVTEVVDAGDIQLVTRIVRRGSASAAAVGVAGGLFCAPIAVIAIAGIAGESRAGYVTMWAVRIGLPIAGGVGAWYGTSRITEEVIFQR